MSLRELTISQEYIALFGSGNSLNEMSEEVFSFIRSRCFVVTMNYAPMKFKGHMNIWMDMRVSRFLHDFYKNRPKDMLFLAQKNQVPRDLKHKIDYWYSKKEDNLGGNYTIVMALQLLQRHFPEKKILLFGVDMYNEDPSIQKWYDKYTAFDKNQRGRRYNIHDRLSECAKHIHQNCSSNNVINCNTRSGLHYFPKQSWQTIFKLKILHLCQTSLAGAPLHLSKIINKYSVSASHAVLRGDFTHRSLRNLTWDYDTKRPSSARLYQLINWADVVHFHKTVYPVRLSSNKRSLIQFHSPPNRYVPEKSFAQFNRRKLVIAQYHPRFYSDAYIVPNLIDIWDETYLPGEKSKKKIKIFFSWATEQKGGWSDKGSHRTRQILQAIQDKYGNRVEIRILNNRPYAECMAEKRSSHICIDECVTGSYHLQSLEGCSVGAVTLNNLDDLTLGFMRAVTGSDSHPFVRSNLDSLFDKLCYYIDNPVLLRRKGKASREWMEKHWNPKVLVNRYLKAYFNVYLHNKVEYEASEGYETRSLAPKSVANTKPVKTSTPQPPYFSVQKLYQKHKGEDIYIFGGGPSIFRVNPNAYKEKICMGINFAFEVVPHMNYHLTHVLETYDCLKKVVDNKSLILPGTLVKQWYTEKGTNLGPQRFRPENTHAYIYPIQDPAEKRLNAKHVSLEKYTQFFTWSSTAHSAIHIAAYMGAKNIFLIGMDYCLYPNGKVHFNSKYSEIYGKQNWDANQKHKQGDEWLATKLRTQGISVMNISSEIRESVRFLS